jgi:hypothetical protein
MKKVLLLIFLGVLFLSIFVYKNKKTLDILEVREEKIEISGPEKKYAIQATYPIIINGIPKESLKIINDKIKSNTLHEVKRNEEEFNQLIKDLSDLPEYASFSYVSEYTQTSDFTKNPFINFIFENYHYSGGAHGGTQIQTFVFDGYSGREISFFDVFNENALLEISKKTSEEIKKIDPKLETYTFVEEGLAPVVSNFLHFTIEPKGIQFVFDDYQVGPYTSGRPVVTLEWKHITSLLQEEFIKNINID